MSEDGERWLTFGTSLGGFRGAFGEGFWEGRLDRRTRSPGRRLPAHDQHRLRHGVRDLRRHRAGHAHARAGVRFRPDPWSGLPSARVGERPRAAETGRFDATYALTQAKAALRRINEDENSEITASLVE